MGVTGHTSHFTLCAPPAFPVVRDPSLSSVSWCVPLTSVSAIQYPHSSLYLIHETYRRYAPDHAILNIIRYTPPLGNEIGLTRPQSANP